MALTKRALILAKEEVTYGVDPVPTPAANAVLVIDPVVTPVGEKLTRNTVKNTLSPDSPLMGKRHCEVTFQTELRGSGVVDVAPRGVGDLFEACGMLETIAAAVSVKYTPASSSLKSVTIYAYFDGLLHKITAAVGSWELVCEAGQIPKISWTFSGFFAAPTDEALPGSVTYDSTIPPIVQNAGFAINSVSTLVVQQVALGLNNTISPRDDINAPTALKGFRVSAREPGGSFNPEAVLVAEYNFYDDWEKATARALELTIGSVAGNKCGISAPKVTLDSIGPGDREGIRVFDIPISLGMDSGDDEVELLFT
ncbi:MAG: hypothetical protein KAX15_02740 [Candidatus Omnitrophica bacterium]|nr:hypothetical protein [Candidatus Omnitrophota bacterium]